jgi:hypothetical protein
MLIDRIGTMDGKGFLEKLPQDYIDRIGLKIPDSLRKLLGDVIRVLLNRFESPEEETEELLKHIDKKEVGTMFDVLVEKYHTARNEGIAVGERKGRKKGRQEGRQEERENRDKEIAKNALAKGWSPQEVAEITGLDLETIKGL